MEVTITILEKVCDIITGGEMGKIKDTIYANGIDIGIYIKGVIIWQILNMK